MNMPYVPTPGELFLRRYDGQTTGGSMLCLLNINGIGGMCIISPRLCCLDAGDPERGDSKKPYDISGGSEEKDDERPKVLRMGVCSSDMAGSYFRFTCVIFVRVHLLHRHQILPIKRNKASSTVAL